MRETASLQSSSVDRDVHSWVMITSRQGGGASQSLHKLHGSATWDKADQELEMGTECFIMGHRVCHHGAQSVQSWGSVIFAHKVCHLWAQSDIMGHRGSHGVQIVILQHRVCHEAQSVSSWGTECVIMKHRVCYHEAQSMSSWGTECVIIGHCEGDVLNDLLTG